MIQIAGRHAGRNAQQTFGLFGRGKQLRDALVGKPVHSNAAARFRPSAQPRNGVGAVGALRAKRIKFSFGITAAANVLNDDVISVAREPDGMSVHDGGGNIAPIGLAHEERRVRAGIWRVVVIGNELDAVAHAGAHAAFQAHAFAAIEPTGLAHGVGGSGKRAISWSAAATRVVA